MAANNCDPCCNPNPLARSVQTYHEAVLVILCAILQAETPEGGEDVNLIAVGGDPVTLGQALMAASIPVTIASNQSNLPTNIAAYGGTATTLGQKAMAASMPVVIASDQASIPVSATIASPVGHGTAAAAVRVELPTDGTGTIASITTSVTPGTAAANLGKAEDGAHTSGDTGVFGLSIRQTTLATAGTADTDLDYQGFKSDQNGVLYVHPVPGSRNNTQFINYILAAGTNATNFSSGVWAAVGFILCNSDTAGVDVWFKLNAAVGGTAPTPGTTAANFEVFVPKTGVPVTLLFPYPLSGTSGVGFWVATGPETASNTGLTNANKMTVTWIYNIV